MRFPKHVCSRLCRWHDSPYMVWSARFHTNLFGFHFALDLASNLLIVLWSFIKSIGIRIQGYFLTLMQCNVRGYSITWCDYLIKRFFPSNSASEIAPSVFDGCVPCNLHNLIQSLCYSTGDGNVPAWTRQFRHRWVIDASNVYCFAFACHTLATR